MRLCRYLFKYARVQPVLPVVQSLEGNIGLKLWLRAGTEAREVVVVIATTATTTSEIINLWSNNCVGHFLFYVRWGGAAMNNWVWMKCYSDDDTFLHKILVTPQFNKKCEKKLRISTQFSASHTHTAPHARPGSGGLQQLYNIPSFHRWCVS